MAKQVQLPAKPDSRKFIIITTDIILNNARANREKWFSHQGESFCVINWDSVWSEEVVYTDILFKNLMANGLIQPRKEEENDYIRTLVQDPYNTNKYHLMEYYDIWNLMSDAGAEKFLIFERLLQILGAKKAYNGDTNFAYTTSLYTIDVARMVMDSIKLSFVQEKTSADRNEAAQKLLRYNNLYYSNEMQGIVYDSRSGSRTRRKFYPYKEIAETLKQGLDLGIPNLCPSYEKFGSDQPELIQRMKSELNYASEKAVTTWNIEFY